MENLQTIVTAATSRQEKRFNLIAHNLSNSQTAGFKKDVMSFKKILSGAEEMSGGSEVTGISFQQGMIQKTGNPLDVAIEGNGFFKVQTPGGSRYTRAGNFTLSRDRVLVNADGFPVMGRRGEVVLNGKNFAVDGDGSIKVDGNEVDKIALVQFSSPELLRKEGRALFTLDLPQEEIEEGVGQVFQGALESSNVNPLEEMVRLVDSLRVYESCMKAIQTDDQLNSRAANELGRV
jgi:flagellar basal-body rod protein FlgF